MKQPHVVIEALARKFRKSPAKIEEYVVLRLYKFKKAKKPITRATLLKGFAAAPELQRCLANAKKRRAAS